MLLPKWLIKTWLHGLRFLCVLTPKACSSAIISLPNIDWKTRSSFQNLEDCLPLSEDQPCWNQSFKMIVYSHLFNVTLLVGSTATITGKIGSKTIKGKIGSTKKINNWHDSNITFIINYTIKSPNL